jgi:hypothetical protein
MDEKAGQLRYSANVVEYGQVISAPVVTPQFEDIPDHLGSAVDIAGNGEAFWFGDRAEEAARWIADQGLAVVGGEVYCRQPVGWATYLGAWTTSPHLLPNEHWTAYVARGLAQAIAVVHEGLPGLEGPPDALPNLRYFFACDSEELARPPTVT